MNKRQGIKLSFISPTDFKGKRIKLENLISKRVFDIPFEWSRSNHPYLDDLKKSLSKNNGIDVDAVVELKNNEYILVIKNDFTPDLKLINFLGGK